MILFHGTLEDKIKKIKKSGLLSLTNDQWIQEIVKQNVCCVSSQPTSGEGGNASFFAYGSSSVKNQNGYLVVFDLPQNVFEEKLITIFDNKVLDDYTRHHFFVREEFRCIGYQLYQALYDYKKTDYNFKDIRKHFSSIQAEVSYTKDQSQYYKNLYKGEKKYFEILKITLTQEFYDFIQHIGNWESFYHFLELHFLSIDLETWLNFQEKTSQKNDIFWKTFYQHFPLNISQVKHKNLENWFSPQWLEKRQENNIGHNSQILMQQIEPDYIKGFIKITTPSGFAERFRSCRSGAGFSKEVWREVHRM